MQDSNLVTLSKPKVGGAAYMGSTKAALPTDDTTALSADFKSLGYISEDGIKNNNTASTDDIKAFGGDVVAVAQTEKPDTFQTTFIEALNVNVLKMAYGDDNVTQTGTKIKITANSKELPIRPFVYDLLLKNGSTKRIVIPRGKLTELGEITYADGELVGYEATFKALPDISGNTHYEYITVVEPDAEDTTTT